MTLYGHDRGEIREVFFRAWRHYRTQHPLEGIERLIVDIALRHPEFHKILDLPDGYHDSDYLPQTGQTNPFLHMGMHITIEEQLALNQPKGILELYRQLLQQTPDEHAAQHQMMDCLGEMLWQAQHRQITPSDSVYLDCLAKLGGLEPGEHRR